MTDKRPIAVKFPTFDLDVEVPEIEMSDEIDASLSTATTTRTMKNITETLSKALKSKYGITDKEELKEKVHDILKLHGLAPENFDPISFASKQVFGDLSTVNDVSVDDNANKTETNMTAVCVESFLPYQKLLGYDYLYQFIKELYGKKIAKECTADMYDFSLFLNDSTKIFLPYCYCIDASKIITEGRNFGQVHSSPAHRISTYISILGDTIREISFNIAGACAVGTFFLDIAHLGIYRERITLDDLRSDKKVRKAMTNHFQQFIHTVNHYSRNAVESPFTNVSCFDRDKLRSLIAEDNYGWYFPKKAAVVEDNNLEDTKEAYKEFVLDYIEELQEIYIDEFDKGDPLRGGLQFPFPVTTCLPADTPFVLNKKLTTFGEAFSEFDSGWTDVEDLYTIYQGKEVKINKVYVGETNQLIEISGTNGHPIKVTPDHKFVLENGQKISASEIKVGDRLMIDKKSKIVDSTKDYILVSDYIDDLWVQGYQLEYTDKVKSLFEFQEYNRSYPQLNVGNVKSSFQLEKIMQLSDEDFRVKPEIDFVRTKESKNKGNIPNKIMLDYNFGRFLGLYYAEGHNSNGEIGFSFNKNEDEYINFIVDYVENVLKLKCKIRNMKNSNGIQIIVYSRTLGLLLDKLIGKYSCMKTINSDLFDSPLEFREAIIRGMIEGDGNCCKWSCSLLTTSKYGANAIGYLLTTLGITSTLKEYKPRSDNNHNIIGKHSQFVITPNKADIISNGYDFGKTSNFVNGNRMLKPKAYIVRNIKYIDTSERIYNIEVDNEEHLYTLPSGLVTSNCNLSVKNEEDGTCHLMSENNRLLNYICKKDVSRYNIYSSEGTKVASCCRLISDSDFMAYAGGVNSFGGSQVSLGSHRVVTLNFARCAYEAESYDDFKKIVSERVARSGKILKAHKALILRLEKLGKQPWISNGWIDMTHMFSTFGCVGYVEADEILKQKFNHVDFDYMKDFLIFFNEECKKIANQENLIFNIEAIPAEGASPKLAKSDRLLVGGTYDIYANQWCSLWKDYTIAEKQKRDGEINSLMTGGSIVHFSTDAKLTPTQAKSMIMKAIEAGNEHFAINCCYSHCPECNTTIKGKLDSCPECHSKKMEWYTRVIGYFSKVQNWNQTRREKDFPNRKFIHEEDFEKELGK